MLRSPLWICLGIAILLAGCGTAPPTTRRERPPAGAASTSEATIEGHVVAAVNAHRAERGLAPLASDADLAALARSHSEAMAAGRVAFGHAGMERRLRAAFAMAGARKGAENVCSQSAAIVSAAEIARATVARWVASEQHRRNMLGSYSITGVGVARAADGRTFVTQIFLE